MSIKGFWGNKTSDSPFLYGVILAVLLLGLLACKGSQETAPKAQVGGRAPDFAVQDLKGKIWTLEKTRGKVLLLRFWNDTCPFCRFEMPVIEKVYSRLKPAGFKVLAVNIKQSPQVVEAFIAQMDVTFPVALDRDGKTAKQYGVYAIPTNFLIDRKGIIRGKLIGEAFSEEKNLRKFLQNYFPDYFLE